MIRIITISVFWLAFGYLAITNAPRCPAPSIKIADVLLLAGCQ